MGELGDSIVFTKRYAHADSGWDGIRLLNVDDASRMEYCVAEGARKSYSSYFPYSRGGGVYISGCSPAFARCSIRNNRTQLGEYVEGGGLAVIGGSPNLIQCEITGNSSGTNWAGSVYCGNGSAARFEQCLISQNSCGGVRVEGSGRPVFVQCQILDNSGELAGIYLSEDSGAVFQDCIIAGNSGYHYGGVAAHSSSARLERCLISRNVGRIPGFYCTGGSPRLIQCTVVGNRSTQFAYGTILLSQTLAEINSCIIERDENGAAIVFSHSSTAQVIYSDFCGLPGSMFGSEAGGPPGIGIVALTNANGDSCDAYYNIFLDPQFVDTAAGDYHLTAGSPCIDAGDPALDPDPDGTVADMGAFYYHQLAAGEERTAVRH
ncbi:right-handed parallel beta-helix repeat-containing protein, partial [bacterium]|nr:right-handed parallel beta-helix repeat-containing protein [bacterium]